MKDSRLRFSFLSVDFFERFALFRIYLRAVSHVLVRRWSLAVLKVCLVLGHKSRPLTGAAFVFSQGERGETASLNLFLDFFERFDS